MAKKPIKKKNKKITASKNQKGEKFLAIFFIAALLIGFIYPLFLKNKTVNPAQRSTSIKQEAPLPPVFKKEGELQFIKMAEQDTININIEVAQTEEEISQGLMYRTSLGKQEGMLFIFEQSEMRSFWMKNTYIPLDILFVTSDYEIITIGHNTEPFSQASVTSTAEAQYVVEVNAGFCDKNGIKEGDNIAFQLM